MLIILITFVTAAFGHSTHIVFSPSVDNYRAYIPVRSVNYPYGTSYGYETTPNYGNVREYSDVSSSGVVYQGRDSVNRRVNTQYVYQNNGQWSTKTATEASQLDNRYYDSNKKNTNVYDYVRRTTDRTRTDEVTNEYKIMAESISESHIKRQSDDVYKYPEQTTDSNNGHTQNENRHVDTANPNNKTISVQIVNETNNKTDQSSISLYHSLVNNTKEDDNTQRNVFPEKTNFNVNKTDDVNTRYEGKTTADNEVTKSYRGSGDSEDDRWIWKDEEVQTTTLVPLDDRAAFSGGSCPTGKVKIGNSCVVPD